MTFETNIITTNRAYIVDLEVGGDGIPVFYIASPSPLTDKDRGAIGALVDNLYPETPCVVVEGDKEGRIVA